MEIVDRNQQIADYIATFAKESEALFFARNNAKEKELKDIAVPPTLGKLISLLAKMQKPQKILEIGTLGGYSALWLAIALPFNGKLITLESDPKNVAVASEHISKASLQDKIEIREGKALDLLPRMASEEGPFDLIFIDADKENYSSYLYWSLELSRVGTLILIDNLIPKRGPIESPHPHDNEALAIYRFNEQLYSHPRLDTILIPYLREKGRIDALGLCIVNEE